MLRTKVTGKTGISTMCRLKRQVSSEASANRHLAPAETASPVTHLARRVLRLLMPRKPVGSQFQIKADGIAPNAQAIFFKLGDFAE